LNEGKGELALNFAQGRRRGLARFIAKFTSQSFIQCRVTNLCRLTVKMEIGERNWGNTWERCGCLKLKRLLRRRKRRSFV